MTDDRRCIACKKNPLFANGFCRWCDNHEKLDLDKKIRTLREEVYFGLDGAAQQAFDAWIEEWIKARKVAGKIRTLLADEFITHEIFEHMLPIVFTNERRAHEAFNRAKVPWEIAQCRRTIDWLEGVLEESGPIFSSNPDFWPNQRLAQAKVELAELEQQLNATETLTPLEVS